MLKELKKDIIPMSHQIETIMKEKEILEKENSEI